MEGVKHLHPSSPYIPRHFLMPGRYPYPFHLPPGLLQVLLPGWGTRTGHSSLFQRKKAAGK